MQKYAFRMQLNPGMEAEYKRRHDAIWPELSALLKDAGISDYSIHLDRETNAVRRAVAHRRSYDGRPAQPSGDAAVVGAHGGHHGDEAGQRAGVGAARHRLSHGVSVARDPAVAVIDIGKSNAKLALVDLATRDVIAMQTTANAVVGSGPYRISTSSGCGTGYSMGFAVSPARRMSPRFPSRRMARASHFWRAEVWRCRCSTMNSTDLRPSVPPIARHGGRSAKPCRRTCRTASMPAADLLAEPHLPGGVRQGRCDPALSAVLGVAAFRSEGDGGDVARQPHRPLAAAHRPLLRAGPWPRSGTRASRRW